MIQLKPLDRENLFHVIDLSDTLSDEQKKCVAPNVISIAQAYVNPQAWPNAIYDDDRLVGFVMLALHDSDIPEEDQPSYFLWRFMIKKDEQSKGYGKKVLDILIEKSRREGQKYLYTSCHIEGDMPYQFYTKYGFVDTHIFDDGEEILKYKL
ncbi:MAG TPA: GNAT family N-acetyltransferase [Acholeplasmataceae bacterium]|nr:GNAT family N-acetyltransferase [Acholeplasmataceae bacterium]